MSARDVELPAGWLSADTEAAARRIAKWQETDKQWTLRTRLALARALVPECAVVPREPTEAMLEQAEDAYFSGYTGTPTALPEDVWRAMLAAGEATP